MTERKSFSWKKRAESFGYACQGLGSFFASEHNAWIHLTSTAAVLILGFLCHLTRFEWMAVCLSIGLVLSAEAFNTCIERTMDMISADRRDDIRFIKDLAAGAVLLSALAAAAVGLLVFLPHLISIL